MSVLDRLLDAVKLNDNYDDDEFLDDDLMDETDEDFLDDDQDGKPVKKFFQKFGKKKDDEEDLDDYDLEEEPERNGSKIYRQDSFRENNCKTGKACAHFFQDHSYAEQQKKQPDSKYGGLCDQADFYGRHS